MKIIIKKPGQQPYITEVEDNLNTYKSIVEGYIEIVPIEKDILMVCNEEGKLIGLDFNFVLGNDPIVGTVFFIGRNNEDFRSLTDEEINKVLSWFQRGFYIERS